MEAVIKCEPEDCVDEDLHWEIDGKILLVGEGNFTFTKALLHNVSAKQLVTSCYQSEKTLKDNFPGTLEVINELSSQGVQVLYEVDATCLESHCFFQKPRTFSRIYFNFPHVGGKTKIKLNRSLIKNFFISAERHLAPNGDICVALCRGQGGTPADKPCREWHDSWQVVAMATHGNLVLSKLVRFDKDLFPGYQPTGFRGRNQWFHTEGALIHVFTRSIPLQDDEWVPDPVGVYVGPEQRFISSYISRRMSRDLTRTAGHPIKWLSSWLQTSASVVLGQSCSQLHLPSPLLSYNPNSWLCYEARQASGEESEVGSSNTTLERLDIVVDRSEDACCLKELHFDVSQQCGSQGGFSYIFHKQNGSSDTFNFQWRHEAESVNFLRPTLLCSLKPESISLDTLNVVSGPVFKRFTMAPQQDDLPVAHELLLMSDSEALPTILSEILRSINVVVESTGLETLYNGSIDKPDWLLELISVVNDIPHCDLNEVWFARGNHHNHPMRFIGSVGSYTTKDATLSFVCLGLDAIATCAFALPSDRLLWSEDKRLFSQLGAECLQAALVCAEMPLFKPWSLYSRPWPCDMSFWLPEGVTAHTFDFRRFIDVIRDVCDDIVTSVRLIDSFVREGRVSLCYRLIFHSYDQARSYSLTWQTQARLRKEMEELFNVTLR